MTHTNDTGMNRRVFMASAAGAPAAFGASGMLVTGATPASAETDAAAPVPASADAAAKAVEALRDPIIRISRDVWATPELSLEEKKSCKVHIRELQAAGFEIVSEGTSGLETAFVAEWTQGSGGAKVGFLPEYDALPGLGNAAEPRQTPGPTGAEVGHGCGHNVLGAGCSGAAMALKAMMEADGTPGTLRVYGCAAEEVQGIKVYMARDGLFDDLDACLAWHPAPMAATGAFKTSATNMVKVMFHGRTAHAGNTPWDGRSALKAAELFGISIQMMREHIHPTARLHYIYEHAGEAPNIVPDFAQVWLTLREVNRDRVTAITDWVRDIAKGAALSTQTEAEFNLLYGMHDLLPNDALFEHTHRHMQAVGLSWTEAEQQFARTCQKQMGLPETGLATEVLPILGEVTGGGATDVGDISYITPTALFGWPSLPQGVSLHTWAVTACGGMSIGDKAALDTARVMAGVGHDVLTDPDLRAAARADFETRRGDYRFVSPIPEGAGAPGTVPDRMTKVGGDEAVSPLRE